MADEERSIMQLEQHTLNAYDRWQEAKAAHDQALRDYHEATIATIRAKAARDRGGRARND